MNGKKYLSSYLEFFIFDFLFLKNFINTPFQKIFSKNEPFATPDTVAWQDNTTTPATRGVAKLFGHASRGQKDQI